MSQEDMQHFLKDTSSEEQKVELVQNMKIAIPYIQHIRVGVYPYSVIAGLPQNPSKSTILALMSFMHVRMPVSH